MDQTVTFECKEYDWGWSVWVKSRGKFHFKKQIASKLKSEKVAREFIRLIGENSKVEIIKKQVEKASIKDVERAKKDSVYFAEEYLDIELENWQKNLLKKYDEGGVIFANDDPTNTVLTVIRKHNLYKAKQEGVWR